MLVYMGEINNEWECRELGGVGGKTHRGLNQLSVTECNQDHSFGKKDKTQEGGNKGKIHKVQHHKGTVWRTTIYRLSDAPFTSSFPDTTLSTVLSAICL